MRAMRRVGLALIVVFALAIFAAAAAVTWARAWLAAPISGLDDAMMFEIPRGAAVSEVALLLAERGVLAHPRIFTLYARLTGRAEGIKAGEYELLPGISPAEMLDLFIAGRVLLHSLTLIEGSTFADVRRQLANEPSITVELASATGEEVMKALGSPNLHPEGQFFPDTYLFARGTTDLEFLRIAHRRMQTELEAAWAERAPDLPLTSPYEALVLASIIEKETALEEERPVIAGVFIERLRRGMRLQTDPTVIYGLGEAFDGNLRRGDLQSDTPYNTYTRAGLPPTPIALPGAGSLRAAVRPQVTGALFFVATGKGDGSHDFSRTLEEHQAAVRRYLRELRRRR